MKRKDWKIKKLKKVSYGKLNKRRRIIFLRKLALRKNLVLVKKNLIMHYVFYKNFFNSLKNKKKLYLLKLHIKGIQNNSKYFFVFPTFFFKKKVFSQMTVFKLLVSNYNSKYFFLNNFNKTTNKFNINFYKGTNILIYSFKNDFNFLENSLLLDENKSLISIKSNKNYYNYNSNESKNLSFFFNYNIVINQNIEIYKIILFLYLKNITLK